MGNTISNIVFDPKEGKIKEKNPTVTVSKSGVVNISAIFYRDISVNSESMLDMLDENIRLLTRKPLCDMNGLFAGRVTITVEFLGDMIVSPTKEEFKAMSFEERLALKLKDENLYNQLAQEEPDGA